MADNAVLARNVDGAPVCDICSQTVAFSHYNHFSAQLPVDASGQLVAGGIKEQAQQCFTNLKTIIEGIDRKLEDTVRVSIFLKDINDLDAVNEVYKTFYKDYLPTRTVVAVDALPLDGALLQVDAVLSHGLGTIPDAPQADDLIILARNTDKAPKCENATQTCAFSHYNNISGQLPVDASGNMVSGGAGEQTEQCLANIKAIVESVDHKMEDVVKVNIYLADMSALAEVDAAYKKFFPDGTPARRVVGVAKNVKDATVLIDAVVSNAEGTPPIL